jgi:hypothetical protein
MANGTNLDTGHRGPFSYIIDWGKQGPIFTNALLSEWGGEVLSEMFLIWKYRFRGSVGFVHSEGRVISDMVLLDVIGAIIKDLILFSFSALVKIPKGFLNLSAEILFTSSPGNAEATWSVVAVEELLAKIYFAFELL